jgi:hypothetical protein
MSSSYSYKPAISISNKKSKQIRREEVDDRFWFCSFFNRNLMLFYLLGVVLQLDVLMHFQH